MNLENLDIAIEELRLENKTNRKNITTRKIMDEGCLCGSKELTHKYTMKYGNRVKKGFKCEKCGEIWREYLDDKFTDSKETEHIVYKNLVFETLINLKRIKSRVENGFV